MKKVFALITLISFVTLQGCSAFKDSTQTVNIQCAEPGTILQVNGQNRTCPTQIEAKRNRDLSIQAHKTGYTSYMRTIGHHFSSTGALDAVGTLLIILPVVGLFTAGAWDLDETDIMVQLMSNTSQLNPAGVASFPASGQVPSPVQSNGK
ncbi:MAG TPA: hypothetical protein HPP97_04065 [Desulfuromonadales bacterium]|nr:hypothetical protein [Desulfuromonadales bacterium]